MCSIHMCSGCVRMSQSVNDMVRMSQSVNDMVRRLCVRCIRVCVFLACVCVCCICVRIVAIVACICVLFRFISSTSNIVHLSPPPHTHTHAHTLRTGLEWESLGELHRTSHGHLKITFPDDILVRTQYWDAVTMLGHGPIVQWPQLDSDGVFVYIYI